MKLSKKVLKLKESATLKMARLARELKEQGQDVISLSLGEPDFDTPAHIKEAAAKALQDGYTKYTPVPGLPDLRKAIIHKFKRDNGLEFKMENIVVSNGAKQSIANLCLALLDPGDEVVVFTPYWVSYYDIIRLNGGVPVKVEAGIEQDFKVRAEQVEKAISEKTKFIIFSSPCNPTGSVYSRDELESIANVVAKYPDILIVSDEIYEYINFSPNHYSIGQFDQVSQQTVTVNGFSKGFAMTGWRIGYMGAPADVAAACSKIQSQFTSGASSFGQKAAAFALESDLSATKKMKEAFRHRKEIVRDLLQQIPGVRANDPYGAFYIFPNISHFFGKQFGEHTITNANSLCEYLLSEAHVATVSGSAFGNDRCIRLSFAASEKDLREAIKRIRIALERLV